MSHEGSAVKGTMYGILIALPFWFVVGWIIYKCL